MVRIAVFYGEGCSLFSLLNEELGLFLQCHHLCEGREKFAMTVLTAS